MSQCQECRSWMVEAFYGELSPERRDSFEAHLRSCSECAVEYAEMESALRVMAERERPDPGQKFWDGYWVRLSQRLVKEEMHKPAKLHWWRRRIHNLSAQPKWVYQAAGAVALIVIGILAGRTLFFPPAPVERAAKTWIQTPISPDQDIITLRIWSYLEKSKLTLLALVNFDPRTEDPYVLNLPRWKEISRGLVTEAAFLKSEIKDPRQKRMIDLVSDIEVVLLQLANLGPDQEIETVDLVKDGVKQRGIILKMILYEMGQGIPGSKDISFDSGGSSSGHKSSF